MTEPIEETYFSWLCAKVLAPRDRNYRDLLAMLHSTEFVWVLTEDRNRAEDGIELRTYFLNETETPNNKEWFSIGCSVFEMLLAFADRAAFQTDEDVLEWFWAFIKNLNLDDFRRVSHRDEPIIKDILYKLVWRTYDVDGSGGLFPLRCAKENQRTIEIWYQFNLYLEELDGI